MLNKIAERMKKAGFNCEILNYHSGVYCDGTEHGYKYKMLYIAPESWTEREYAMKAAKRILRGTLKDDYIIEGITFSKAFHIVAKADRIQATEASAEATAFCEAYWDYMHENAPHSPDGRYFVGDVRDYSEKAIEAGKAAVKAWREICTKCA